MPAAAELLSPCCRDSRFLKRRKESRLLELRIVAGARDTSDIDQPTAAIVFERLYEDFERQR
jgi:hypothetical protein